MRSNTRALPLTSIRIRFALILLIVLSGTTYAVNASAGSVWSPEVLVIGLQVRDGEHGLRVGFRRRLELSAPAFDFNPANCASAKFPFVISGTNASAQYVTVELQTSGPLAAERDQMINEIYTAFGLGRMVRFLVRDDACSSTGARLSTGVEVLF